MDPFLGAGSSLYAVRDSQYKFVGAEINEQPIKIAKFNARGVSPKIISELSRTLARLETELGDIYKYKLDNGEAVEFVKAVINRTSNSIQAMRVICINNARILVDSKDHPELLEQYENRIKKYKLSLRKLPNPKLIKNSRIAVKENMRLADIFTPTNYYLLDRIRSDIRDNDDIKFVLGSVLHLCKLTDQKSQSQFPYWLPKTGALDRNIFLALNKKIRQLQTQLGLVPIPEYGSFQDLKQSKNGCLLINKPLQKLTSKDVPDESIDFVLTDPPYYDQVAYSEYLKIWEHFLGYMTNLEDEVVVSQRSIQTSDVSRYEIELAKAFSMVNKKMKPGAIMVVYFKETRLDKVESFLKILKKSGFDFLSQEYISSKLYTYKQNTTKDTTLGGDSIYIFKRIDRPMQIIARGTEIKIESGFIDHVIKAYAYQKKAFTLNDIMHDVLVRELYRKGWLSYIKNTRHIIKAINQFCVYDQETRIFHLKEPNYKNEILYSDALDFLRSLPAESVNSCITDPPYNISGYDSKKKIGWLKSNEYWTGTKNFQKIDESWDKFSDYDYIDFSRQWLYEVKRVVKPNGNIAVFGSYHNIYKIGSILDELDLKIVNSLVWYKRNAFPNITQRMFCESTEHIVWAVNNSKKHAKNWTFNYKTLKEMNGGIQMRNMFDLPLTKKSEKEFGKHPSQKPLRLLEILTLGLTNKNDIVLDPFAGSGTTGVAAQQNDRFYLLADNEYSYVKLMENRIANLPQKLKL